MLLFVCFEGFSQVKFYTQGAGKAAIGEYYQIHFVLENAEGNNFTPPNFKGFQVVSGPNQSSNYSWINGRTSSSLTISYYLLPEQEGMITIDPARVRVGDKTLVTESLTVEVVAGRANNNTANNNGNPDSNNSGQSWKQQAAENIFIRLYTDNTSPYVGEQITVYAKLYQRIDAYNTHVTEMPKFEGFWNQEIDVSGASWKEEEYNGKYYHTLVAGKFALFPQKDGEFTISPYELYTELQVTKQSNRNDFWSQFFQEYELVEYTFKSNPLTITAKNLPLEGQPENFSGAVGNYQFTAAVDSTEIQLGSPIHFETEIKGTGNIMMVDMPLLDFPSNIEVYDPETQETISEKSIYVNGTKHYDYVLVPELPGVYTLPSIDFSYFNPKEGLYHTIETEQYRIKVDGEMPQEVLDSIHAEQEVVAANELYPIVLENDLKKKPTSSFYGTKTFYSLIGATPLFSILFLLLGRKIKNREVDLIALKYRKAQKMAEKRLKKAAQHKKNDEVKPFYDEIIRALLDYSSDKMNIDRAYLSKENIGKKLTDFGVSQEKINILKSLIENCELALFANAQDNTMDKDFEIAKQIIIDIENELNA